MSDPHDNKSEELVKDAIAVLFNWLAEAREGSLPQQEYRCNLCGELLGLGSCDETVIHVTPCAECRTGAEGSLRTPTAPTWEQRWAAYETHVAIHPDDKDNWRVFFAGCCFEAQARGEASQPTPPTLSLDLISETIHSMFLHDLIMKRLREVTKEAQPAPALHRVECGNFGNGPIGGPGCICKPKQLSSLRKIGGGDE
jgi:hypothetical protein